jgi:hypothetical protein
MLPSPSWLPAAYSGDSCIGTAPCPPVPGAPGRYAPLLLHWPLPRPHNSCTFANAQATPTESRGSGAVRSRSLWITRSRQRNVFYRGRMRIANPRCATAAAAAVLALLAFAGCQSAPTPAPTSTESADAPVFASDEEALAAATEAYAAYQAMSSRVAQEGGASPSRMAEYATGAALEAEISSLASLEGGNLRGMGDLAFDSMTVQSSDLVSGKLEAYLCLDVSATDVVDQAGKSTVPTDRPVRLPLEVAFVFSSEKDRLLVEKSESWSGTNFC